MGYKEKEIEVSRRMRWNYFKDLDIGLLRIEDVY